MLNNLLFIHTLTAGFSDKKNQNDSHHSLRTEKLLFDARHHSLTHLHEEPGHKRLPDVEVVVPAGELGAGPPEVEPVHDSRQLFSDVVSRLERSRTDEVVVAPLSVLAIWNRSAKRVKARIGTQMERRTRSPVGHRTLVYSHAFTRFHATA